jgi:hypothetical protein
MNEDRPSPNYKSARECAIDEQAQEWDEYEDFDEDYFEEQANRALSSDHYRGP